MPKNNEQNWTNALGKVLRFIWVAFLKVLSFSLWVILSGISVLLKEIVAFLKKYTFPKD